jgi:glutathione S-transferase
MADLDHMEGVLDTSPFLLGEAITIVDVSCCGYLFWIDEAEIHIERWPAVKAWLARIRMLPGWQSPNVLLCRQEP